MDKYNEQGKNSSWRLVRLSVYTRAQHRIEKIQDF